MRYRILALEPFYGGSHQAFLDGWRKHSRHHFTLLTLPDNCWRWRMRHAAPYFARKLQKQSTSHSNWDIVFCSDMLNLAEFCGLAHPAIARLPRVIFFHENQLVYPVHDPAKHRSETVWTNFTSALSATAVWFNSAHNRDSFLHGLPGYLRRMPDYQPYEEIENIRLKSSVMPLGIDIPTVKRHKSKPPDMPLHILWAARWEADKNPQAFFRALRQIKRRGKSFLLSVTGEAPAIAVMPIFERAKSEFADNIVNWGYIASRRRYQQLLSQVDIAVSTANHEFFGLSMLEAAAAGAYPLLPLRLSYPEIFSDEQRQPIKPFFYGNSDKELAEQLIKLIERHERGEPLLPDGITTPREIAERYRWERSAAALDAGIEELCRRHR